MNKQLEIAMFADEIMKICTEENQVLFGSALILILCTNVKPNMTKEFWLDELSKAWDHYKEMERLNDQP